jgi:adenylate cyclase
VERKFLVTGSEWKHHIARSVGIRQAYLSVTAALTIRVRIVDDAEAFLTFKSAAPDVSRTEFEYSIPLEDARELVELRKGRMVEKRRHIVLCGGAKWEVDVFAGDHDDSVADHANFSEMKNGFWFVRSQKPRRKHNGTLVRRDFAPFCRSMRKQRGMLGN